MKKQIHKKGLLVLLVFFSGWMACNNGKDKTNSDSTNSTMGHAEATIAGTFADTSVTGSAEFFQQENGKIKLSLTLEIPAKANKSIAVHIHENGACSDTGKAAGGHWNPTDEMHGEWGSGNFHSGDIGNVNLDSQGKGTLTMETDRWTIGGDAKTNILNKTLIVHGGMDDYTSQPSGNSGARIGCGIIREITTKM